MGQGSSKERYKNAVKKLSSLELENIQAVFNEISTKREDGTRHVQLSLVNRQDFAERLRLPGFIAERLFHAFDRTEVSRIFTICIYNIYVGVWGRVIFISTPPATHSIRIGWQIFFVGTRMIDFYVGSIKKYPRS